MRCMITLEKTTQPGDVLIADTYVGECGWTYGENGYYDRVYSEKNCVGTDKDTCFLTPGTYTVTAGCPEGKALYVRAYSYFDGERRERFPADGSAAPAPFTFTLTEERSMMFDFGFGADWDDDSVTTANTNNVRVHDTNGASEEVTETVAIMPGEIPDSDALSEALCAKKVIDLLIPRGIEAFGFAEQTVTIVRAFDLDLPSDRMIFKGRVTAVVNNMTEAGLISQTITCESALDFLSDTEFGGTVTGMPLVNWVNARCWEHNGKVDRSRWYTANCTVTAWVDMHGDDRFCSNREILGEVLTGGKYLTSWYGHTDTVKAEYRERYVNDVVYVDIAEQFGTPCDTPFKIGENLRSIRVEQTADHGIYCAVKAVSGVNSDGKRASCIAYNADMWQRFGGGRILILQADDIRCTAECYTLADWAHERYEPTEAYTAMLDALQAYARQEADKLSAIPIRITLTAADLAVMGFDGYERFEVGNSHPLVYPPAGYYGQRVRITGLKRRLSDGRVEQITIESGEVPGGKSRGSTLTAMMARLAELNERTNETETKLTEIAETKASEQTGGLEFAELTQAEFDSIAAKDSHTVYYVDDNGAISLYKGSYHISTGGGGGDEPTIETACVLTTEQMTEWAPDHALVPVEFRGNASVYYGQPPSRFVLQGQRAIYNVDEETEVTENDIMSEITLTFRDGTTQKIKAFAYNYYSAGSYHDITMGVVCCDLTSGTVVGQAWNANNYWVLPSSFTSIKAGFALRVTGFYMNEDGELAPNYWIRLHVFADGTQAQPYRDSARDLPYISGCLFDNGSNADFGSAAERGFASGISITTEPVYPNGSNGGE